MPNIPEDQLEKTVIDALIKSAYRGDTRHQVDLAYRYLTGYDVDQSMENGYAWAYVSFELGSSEEGKGLMDLVWFSFITDLKRRNALIKAKDLCVEVNASIITKMRTRY